MFQKAIYNYPIDKVMEALGCRKGTGTDMWFSPFRDESEASFHIDRGKNLWYDHGLGMGGSIIKLIMLVRHCGCKEAESFVTTLDPSIQTNQPERRVPAPATETHQATEIKAIRGIKSDYLTRYLSSRKIPLELAHQYLKEMED